jgi:hypothetical protein
MCEQVLNVIRRELHRGLEHSVLAHEINECTRRWSSLKQLAGFGLDRMRLKEIHDREKRRGDFDQDLHSRLIGAR